MFGFENLNSRMNNIVREGVVSAVYPEKHSCRVSFSDRSNLVSAELPILVPFANKNKSYNLVDVGDTVVCLIASSDQTSGGGYVIGSLYTSETPPPEASQDIVKIEFADKAFISYDRAAHLFTIQFSDETSITHDGESGELSINCKGDIIINGEKQLDVTIKDRITIDGKDEINVDASGDINMNASNIRLN